MGERLLGRRNFREIVVSFKNRILGSPAAPPETPEEASDNRRMWEILNKVPLRELNSMSPEEIKRWKERSARDLRAQLDFQASLSQTPKEFFGKKSSTEDAREITPHHLES